MRSKLHDDGSAPDPIAEMRAVADETRRAIETSQAILDRCAAHPSGPDAEPAADATDFLGEISDGLIHAHRFAQQDGDAATVALIERALLHVARRLALGLSPAEVGIACH